LPTGEKPKPAVAPKPVTPSKPVGGGAR